jgi:hypothetical protein
MQHKARRVWRPDLALKISAIGGTKASEDCGNISAEFSLLCSPALQPYRLNSGLYQLSSSYLNGLLFRQITTAGLPEEARGQFSSLPLDLRVSIYNWETRQTFCRLPRQIAGWRSKHIR